MEQQNKKWYVDEIHGVSSTSVHYMIAGISIKYIFDFIFLIFLLTRYREFWYTLYRVIIDMVGFKDIA